MDTGWREKYSRNKNLFTKTLQLYSQKPSLKAYLELFLSLITISVFGIFAIRPTLITIGKLYKEIHAKEKTLVVMKEKIEKLTSAQSIYNKETDNIKLLKMAIPDNPAPQELIRQIENLSAVNSVTLTGMTVNTVKLLTLNPKPNVKSEGQLVISLTLKGSYENLSNFINQLENLRRPIKLGSLDFSPRESADGSILILSIGDATLPYIRIGEEAVVIEE